MTTEVKFEDWVLVRTAEFLFPYTKYYDQVNNSFLNCFIGKSLGELFSSEKAKISNILTERLAEKKNAAFTEKVKAVTIRNIMNAIGLEEETAYEKIEAETPKELKHQLTEKTGKLLDDLQTRLKKLEENTDYQQKAKYILTGLVKSPSKELTERVEEIKDQKNFEEFIKYLRAQSITLIKKDYEESENKITTLKEKAKKFPAKYIEDYYETLSDKINSFLGDNYYLEIESSSKNNKRSYQKYLENLVKEVSKYFTKTKFHLGDSVYYKKEETWEDINNIIKKEGKVYYELDWHDEVAGASLELEHEGSLSQDIKEYGTGRRAARKVIKKIEEDAKKEIEEEILSVINEKIEKLDRSFAKRYGISQYVPHSLRTESTGIDEVVDKRIISLSQSFSDVKERDKQKIKQTLEKLSNTYTGIRTNEEISARLVEDYLSSILKNEVENSARSELLTQLVRNLQENGLISKEIKRAPGVYNLIPKGISKLLKKREEIEIKRAEGLFKEHNLNLEALSKKYSYITDKTIKPSGEVLDCFKMCEEFQNDLVSITEKLAKNERHKKLTGLARVVLNEELPNEQELIQALSKENKQYYYAFRKLLKQVEPEKHQTKGIKAFNTQDLPEQRKIILSGEETAMLKSYASSWLYRFTRDIIFSELIKILETAGPEHRDTYESCKIFWERYDPTQYLLENIKSLSEGHVTKRDLKKEYKFRVSKDPQVLCRAAINADSCLKDKMDMNQWYSSDPGTINLIVEAREKIQGYVRCFLMKTKKNESVLAIDTLEIGHKDFLKYNDYVRAMGLATIQLGRDLGVKYIVGTEGRLKFGMQQGFRNKKMKTKLQKLGEVNYEGKSYRPYSFEFNKTTGEWEGEVSVVYQSWK